MRLVAFILLVLFAWGRAWAQSTLTQNLSSAKPPQFSGNVAVSYNSNLHEPSSNSNLQSMSGETTLSYRVKDAHLLRTFFSGYKELNQGEEWRANDGFVGWVNNGFWHEGERFTLGQQLRVTIPYSKESRERDHRETGVSVVPVASVVLAPTVTFVYQPQLIRNFHSRTVNRAGENNTQWALNQTAALTWSMTDKLYAQAMYLHSMAWNYRGDKKDDAYQVGGELGLSVTSALTLAAGWSNKGAIRSFENGTDQSVRVFDNKTSTIYTALYWIF